jgi:hypothetical protein
MNTAAKLKLDFVFTLCFANADHPIGEREKIKRWAPLTRRGRHLLLKGLHITPKQT